MPPRHQRPARPTAQRSASPTGAMTPSMSSLDAKMKLFSQRMKIIENNMQVMGRTIVSLKNKVGEIEKLGGSGGKAPDLAALKKSLKEELAADMKASGGNFIAPPLEPAAPTARDDLQNTELRKSVETLRQEVNELKYIMESINPLEYVTLDQLNDVVERKISKMKP